jgi:proline- and glutamine-rich splicing factor
MYAVLYFVSLQDYRANAEKAKRELDGQMRKGRALKVRFAPHSAAVKVKNLTPWVSNELLEKAFSVFGEVSFSFVDNSNAMGEKTYICS